jgi:hypothetical protein
MFLAGWMGVVEEDVWKGWPVFSSDGVPEEICLKYRHNPMSPQVALIYRLNNQL